jgi:catechol 2,3-dioxygenase-like lactoylglutathione lyase family enzyme
MRWSHVGITVRDIEKSLAFYRDALGLNVIMDEIISSPGLDSAVEKTDATIRAVVLADEAMNMIELIEWQSHQPKERPPEHLKYISTGLVEICLSVPDLEACVKDLEKKGYKNRTPIWHLEAMGREIPVTHVEDPDGVQVELVQI